MKSLGKEKAAGSKIARVLAYFLNGQVQDKDDGERGRRLVLRASCQQLTEKLFQKNETTVTNEVTLFYFLRLQANNNNLKALSSDIWTCDCDCVTLLAMHAAAWSISAHSRRRPTAAFH
jgi:hypothetical protein